MLPSFLLSKICYGKTWIQKSVVTIYYVQAYIYLFTVKIYVDVVMIKKDTIIILC